jgi:sialic acid synthase
MQIDGIPIGDEYPAFVIAEIGHNHTGDIGKAVAMVKSAALVGASAVKFQTRHPKEVYSPSEYNRESDNPHWMAPTYGEHRKALEFLPETWELLFEVCAEMRITAFSTPFDFSSADQLNDIGVPAFKVASGDATNIPLIQHIAAFGKPMIVSTGGCTIQDVDRVYTTLKALGAEFALLQCSTVYPAPADVLNLNVIDVYRKRYSGTPIGLSTHHPDWTPNLAAYALGARIFEHHYTVDRKWKGTDNHFSLTPDSMRDFVQALAVTRDALGKSYKEPDERELAPTLERRKALYWTRNMEAGETIRREDVSILCPGKGIAPYELDRIVGSVVSEDIWPEEGKAIQWSETAREVPAYTVVG